MKKKQLAREVQGYRADTPICCRTCSNRKEHLCAVGGFPVRLFGYCRCWGTSIPTKPARVVSSAGGFALPVSGAKS